MASVLWAGYQVKCNTFGKKGGEVETYRFSFQQEGVAACNITNSPWANGIGLGG